MVVSGAFVVGLVGLVADSEDDFSDGFDGFVGSAFATSCDVVSEVSSSTFPSSDWEAASSVSSWFSPAALDSFGIGMILTLRQNSSVLEASAQRLTSMEKAAYFIKAIGSNERILLLMAALVVTIVVVYMIRKLPYSYAWAIAIAAGTACYVLTVLVGNVAFGVTVHLLYLSISIILGVLISSVLHVFLFLLDGTHTEFLEYEDENYVYYVRAIPKYSVARTDKKVTTITKAGDGETSEEDSFLDDDQSLDDYFRT